MPTIKTTGNVGEAVRQGWEAEARRRSGITHPRAYRKTAEVAPEPEEETPVEVTETEDAELVAHLEQVEENIQAVLESVTPPAEEEAEEEVSEEPEPEPEPAVDEVEEEAPSIEAPSKVTGSLEEWQKYRLATGYTEEEIEGLGRNDLRALPDK